MHDSVTAESLGIPATFNGASWISSIGTSPKDAARTSRSNAATRESRTTTCCATSTAPGPPCATSYGVRPEERVLLLLLDGPEFFYSFFGAIKIGAVPVPLNTLWKPARL